ncbi:sigma-70 family RNA polymerase sigma factor [Mucilaginibacter conchicola]|uniref:Sigma-70 family RNA polymerase sigma factor n=1 Tax=Mucilaginibacter conchicola TaxID=2303333 RepID=A0A372NY90_9SPHI|nr:sigma-70 family RNA polymerase sigma factor [Mucilaginibacter conchicola]RFZ94639.1 sigma-70 family RNA polymerase sigma factor [Mucilaginibacter conchicola]
MDKAQKETRFKHAVAANAGMLHKICRIYQDDATDREDLMQEIMLQLWTAFDTYRGESALGTWLYRVALNTAIMYFKKQKRRPDSSPMPEQFDAAYVGFDDTPEQQLAIFYQAVKQLDKLDKALVILYMEDQPYSEIALALGISEGSARTRMNRAKTKLKEIIKTLNYEY